MEKRVLKLNLILSKTDLSEIATRELCQISGALPAKGDEFCVHFPKQSTNFWDCEDRNNRFALVDAHRIIRR